MNREFYKIKNYIKNKAPSPFYLGSTKIDFLIKTLIPYKIRTLDKEFYNFFKLLKDNEKKSYELIKKYQFMKFKNLINNAYKFSSFYKKKYNEAKFNPKDFNSFLDIGKIPLLTKDEIRENSKSIILSNFKGQIYEGHTSGTTGKPLTIYYDNKTLSREKASISYQWERIGYKPTDGRIEFRGFVENNKDFIYLPNSRILRINIIKMSEKNLFTIIKKVKSTGYNFYMGYPSALYKFAKILEKTNIKLHPKGIMLASEVVYDWQMELIDKIFPYSKKIAHYGQAERIALGAWYQDRKYHFIPSYGFLEFYQKNKELIATGFINEIMPIIRYKLTDSIEDYQFEPSNNEKTLFPVINTIYGREEDFTYSTNGDLIPPAVVTFPFKHLILIKSCKIIQNSLSEFNLMIEAEENNRTLNEVNNLINELKKIYGQNVNMRYQFLKKIPEDKSGKFRWIECKINNL